MEPQMNADNASHVGWVKPRQRRTQQNHIVRWVSLRSTHPTLTRIFSRRYFIYLMMNADCFDVPPFAVICVYPRFYPRSSAFQN
jgi:hypothetical protein